MITQKYSTQLELRVLENLMAIDDFNNVRVQKAILSLTYDCFYKRENAQLFCIIRDAFHKQESFNYVDVLIKISPTETALHKVMDFINEDFRVHHVNDASLEMDIDKLLVLMTLRKQLHLSENMLIDVNNCAEPIEAHKILREHLNNISNLNYAETKHGISNFEVAEAFYDGTLRKDLIIQTSCQQLNDALNGGITAKSLIVVAAGAGVGKTGFSIFLLDAIARAQPDTHSLFFSLEMEAKHIWMRHVGIKGGKQFDKLTDDERLKAVSSALEISLHIYDSASCHSANDIDFIVTTARIKAMEKPLSVIVVDYLGLVESKGSFERNDLKLSDITAKLAKLALELNCTVIALSQINRTASARAIDDRCPYPSDAADSSGGHRSSTLWLGVDRPELYQSDLCYKNQFVVKCRKNRFGGCFEIILAFNDGTFAETYPGEFRKPYIPSKNPVKAVFSAHSKDYYPD